MRRSITPKHADDRQRSMQVPFCSPAPCEYEAPVYGRPAPGPVPLRGNESLDPLPHAKRCVTRVRSILLPSAIASAGILLVSSRLQSVSAALAPPGGCLLIPRRQVGVF